MFSMPSDQWPPPDPVPTTGRHLEIRLLDKVEASGLPELCIKVAKSRHCRSLAREAWFYSRLATLQGNAIPCCFGFFTVLIADCIPWNRISMKKIDQVDGDDWLPDDVYDYCFDPNDGGYKASSPWDKWKYAPDQPLVAVLVMEKLGEPYYPDCSGDDPPHKRRDLRNVVYDLGQAGFVHADMRFNDVLRAVNQGIFCPRHNCYHRWHLIDFDHSR
ncbi:hypothetical protein EDD85DRAFT_1026230 [Armillaria nabsnona]|nr:hypothetical protein EDD85DRAFT_1026230 [Armillaria nabsnona]